MDPDACLSDIFDLLVEGDYVAAGQKARELLEWMGKGGFAQEEERFDLLP